MHGECGLCDGSVRKKSCIQYGTATSSSLITRAEGGPQPKRGGKAKKIAELFEGPRNSERERGIKIVSENIPPFSTPVKNLKLSEIKKPYMGATGLMGTPIKRKLVQNQSIKNLIGIFYTRSEPELPGGADKCESPAKRPLQS